MSDLDPEPILITERDYPPERVAELEAIGNAMTAPRENLERGIAELEGLCVYLTQTNRYGLAGRIVNIIQTLKGQALKSA